MVKAARAVSFFLVFKYPKAKSHDVLHPVSAMTKATGCQQLQQGLAVPPTPECALCWSFPRVNTGLFAFLWVLAV